MTAIVWPAVLAAACLLAAGLDLRARRIPNLLCLATAVAGAAYAWSLGGIEGLGLHLLHAAIALVAGMALFAARLIGGGDAKFYAAVALWFEPAMALRLVLWVGLSGVLLLLIWMVVRRKLGKPWRTAGGDPFDSLPYGIAIGLGAVAAFLV